MSTFQIYILNPHYLCHIVNFSTQFSTKWIKTAKINSEVEEMKTILCILLGYLLGSLPFALIIGKVFYHTDIRQYGSGNLGGTNAGRVLGKKAGISVIVFDVLKVVLAIAAHILAKDTYLNRYRTTRNMPNGTSK